jgi:hypothetical protein
MGYLTGSNFSSVYYTDYDNFISEYGYHGSLDIKELFAEGFWKYYIDRERFSSACPTLYSYLDSYLSVYESEVVDIA